MIRYSFLFVVLALIGVGDYLTGYEVSFVAIYLVPVVAAGWYLGKRAGIGFSFLAAALWMTLDRLGGHTYSHSVFLFWNGSNRFVLGVAGSLAAAAIRRTLGEQKSTIFELRRTLLSLNELRGQVPRCPICHSFRADQSFRMELERFVGDQSEPDALGRPCPTCVAQRAQRFSEPRPNPAHSVPASQER